MPEDSPHQPHDKLFKAGFSDPATAGAFLRLQFSEALSSKIGWDDLHLEPANFVDSHFRESESDLLFSAPFGGAQCLVYLLFEHQRAKDPWIGLRLLRYMLRIWEKHLHDHPETTRLPVILPVVVAQNAGRWEMSSRFADLLEIPEGLESALVGQVPDFLFRLVQLAEIPFEKIAGTPAGILVLRVLKADVSGDLLGHAVWDEEIIKQVSGALFELVLRYMFARDVDKTGFYRRIESLREPVVRKNAMSLAQQIRQEGRQEGHQEGHQEGRQEGRQEGQLESLQASVIEVLDVRFGGVPEGLREEILKNAVAAKLHDMHRLAVRCPDLESFAREL